MNYCEPELTVVLLDACRTKFVIFTLLIMFLWHGIFKLLPAEPSRFYMFCITIPLFIILGK